MKKTEWELSDDNGIVHNLSYYRYVWKRPKIFLDNAPVYIPRDFESNLSQYHDIDFMVGGIECHLVIKGKNADVFYNGVSINSGKLYVPLLPMPRWAWIFTILSLAVAFLGGAVPVMCGMLGAAFCISVAKKPKINNFIKVFSLLGITVASWGIVIIVSMALASALY